MADNQTDSSATRKELNRQMRMAVKRFDLSVEEADTWDFLCECGADDCTEWVTLPVSEFEALREAGEPILALGHVAHRAPRSRRNAQRLVEDARALGAQAAVQLKRSARILKKTQSP